MPTDLDKPKGRIRVLLANEQTTHAIDERQLVEAATAIVRDSSFTSATISLAVVDDPTMHELNRRHLDHDYPTDVLSFVLAEDADHLEGEVIISSDTAAAEANERGWPAAAEQLLYVIHGTLHLVGFGDKSPQDAEKMRVAEEKYLRRFGFSQMARNGFKTREGEAPTEPNACTVTAQQELRPPINGIETASSSTGHEPPADLRVPGACDLGEPGR